MPKQINTPNPAQGLVKQFALKGRYQPVLDETIVPVVDVSQFAPAVNVARTRLCSASVNYGPTSGTPNVFLYLYNPVDSGALVTVTAVRLSASLGSTSHSATNAFVTARELLSDSAPAPAGAFPVEGPAFRDSRLKRQPRESIPIAQPGGTSGALVYGAWDEIGSHLLFPSANMNTVAGTGDHNTSGQLMDALLAPVILEPGWYHLFLMTASRAASGGGWEFEAKWVWQEAPLTSGTEQV